MPTCSTSPAAPSTATSSARASSDTVDFAPGANNTFTYSGTITGVLAVNVNSGTLLLLGTIDPPIIATTITIAGGASLLVDAAGIDTGVATTDNGVLGFEQSGAVTYAGGISGTGLVKQIGTGTTDLTGADSVTGGTNIAAGTLELGSGGSVAHNATFTAAGATLELNTGTNQLSGNIAGAVAGDNIDLDFQAFAAGDKVVWTQSGATGTLKLETSGGTVLDTLTLTGTYTSANFTPVTDNHGGTLIKVVTPSNTNVWNKIDGGTPVAMAGGDFDGLGSAQLAVSETGGGTYIYVPGGGFTKISSTVYAQLAAGNLYGTTKSNNNNIDLAAAASGGGVYVWSKNGGLTKIDGGTATAIAAGTFKGGSVADLVMSESGAGTYLWQKRRLHQDRRRRLYADGGRRFLRHQPKATPTIPISPPSLPASAPTSGANVGWKKIDGGTATVYAAGNFLGTSNGNNNQTDLAVYFPGSGTYIWSANAGWMKIDSGTATGLASVDLNGDGQNELLAYFKNAGMYEWQCGVGWTKFDSTKALPATAQTALFAEGNFQGGSVVARRRRLHQHGGPLARSAGRRERPERQRAGGHRVIRRQRCAGEGRRRSPRRSQRAVHGGGQHIAVRPVNEFFRNDRRLRRHARHPRHRLWRQHDARLFSEQRQFRRHPARQLQRVCRRRRAARPVYRLILRHRERRPRRRAGQRSDIANGDAVLLADTSACAGVIDYLS